MKGMCWLLLLCAAASAQPVFGPYEIVTTDTRIRDLETCVRGDTVDAVWIQDSLVVWQRFDLAQAAPFGEAETTVQTLHNWPKLELHDLTARNESQWCCVVYEDEAANSGQNGVNLTGFLSGSGTGFTRTQLDSSVSAYEQWEGVRSGFSVDRINDTLVSVVWLGQSWDPRLFGTNMYCATFGSGTEPMMREVVSHFSLAWNMASRALTWRATDVYLRALVSGTWYAALSSCYTISQSDWNCDFNAEFDPVISSLIDAGHISSNSGLLLYSSENSYNSPKLLQLVNPDSSNFQLDTLGPVGLNYVTSSFFQRDYGFAVVEANPGYLLLARMDTTGQPAQPVGVLYETDGSSFIADADVTITDDGKVVCAWSEYSDWGEGPRVTKIAWVDWATYLDAPDENAPSVPREFALSAYPNPFNASVTISFDLPQSGEVALRVFDLQGRLVTTLFDERFAAGEHNVSWSPENLSSGVYFAQLTSAQSVRNTKLLYLK